MDLFWELVGRLVIPTQAVVDHFEAYAVEWIATVFFTVLILATLRLLWLVLPKRWRNKIMRKKGVLMMGKKARRLWVDQRVAQVWTDALIDDHRAGGLTMEEVNGILRKAGRTLGYWDMVPKRRVCVHEPAEMLKQVVKFRLEQAKRPLPFPDSSHIVDKEVQAQRTERKIVRSRSRRVLISKPQLA